VTGGHCLALNFRLTVVGRDLEWSLLTGVVVRRCKNWPNPDFTHLYRNVTFPERFVSKNLVFPQIALSCLHMASVILGKDSKQWFSELHLDLEKVQVANSNSYLMEWIFLLFDMSTLVPKVNFFQICLKIGSSEKIYFWPKITNKNSIEVLFLHSNSLCTLK